MITKWKYAQINAHEKRIEELENSGMNEEGKDRMDKLEGMVEIKVLSAKKRIKTWRTRSKNKQLATSLLMVWLTDG